MLWVLAKAPPFLWENKKNIYEDIPIIRAMGQRHKDLLAHYEHKPIQIYWKFYHQKMKIFR